MTIEETIKKASRKANKYRRRFLSAVLGEFSRLNDGKPITDEVATKSLEKMIKDTKATLELTRDAMLKVALQSEIEIMEGYLPEVEPVEYASDRQMQLQIDTNVPGGLTVQQRMPYMKTIIAALETGGLEVDKKRLSELLRGIE